MADQTLLQKLFQSKGAADFHWIDPGEIVVAQWVRMKCTFGCGDYGRNASCPPNTPSVAECREFFEEYRLGAIFRFHRTFEDPEGRHEWTRKVNQALLALEREVFIAGFPKAFILFMDNCKLCKECASVRTACRNRQHARPTPEGMGVDLFSTVAKFGFPIEVLSGYEEEMNRYAILLIE